MKRSHLFMLCTTLMVLGLLTIHHAMRSTSSRTTGGSVFPSDASEGTHDNPHARLEEEWLRLHDPATKQIPPGIERRALDFARRLSAQPGLRPVTTDEDWVSRGPYNIGGRTRALGIDVTNEDVILAGGVSSGMFKSTDGGRSWRKTTAPHQLHSVTALAQNTVAGREHIWYYGTGDRHPAARSESNSASVPRAFYRGDGIFKSVDGGDTWSLLPATVSGTPAQTDPFDIIWGLVTFGVDGVLAATASGVYKSTDGGSSWTASLTFGGGETYPSTEIAIAADGTFYATIGGSGPDNGIYRSTDGDRWENITPDDWPDATIRTVMSTAPSNPDVVYFFTEIFPTQQLRKYTARSGWTDLTAGLPFNAQIATFQGALMELQVKPDDENTLFLGAIDLFRSTDGGASFEVISGTGAGFHVDQFAIDFYPSDPDRMIVGNDGGLYRTDDNMATTRGLSLDWESLNNGYLTTQYYTTAIDHGTPGSEVVIGGTQDNGVTFTSSAAPEAPWTILRGGDGAFTEITDGGEQLYYATAATFGVYRSPSTGNLFQPTEITPAAGRLGLFLTPFRLDPHDQKIMYLPSQRTLFRNSDLRAIPDQPNAGPTDINWDTFDHATDHYITALGMSGAMPRRLYYAGFLSDQSTRLLYLSNPHQGQPVPVEITGANFPNYPFSPPINCIEVDPRDANKVLVVFASYGVLSIYATDDGGQTWTPVSGNLEENPDGTGNGPSVRWVKTLYVDDQPVYLAGTSVGLFSSTRLDGMNTIWSPEGRDTIGNVVVPMIDVRQSDGYVAVATHGNGIYTTYITELPEVATSLAGPVAVPAAIELLPAYPNPFNTATTLTYQLPRAGMVTASVYNLRGQKIETLVQAWQQAGRHELRWEASEVASGVYFIRLDFGDASQVTRVVLQR